MEMKQFGFGCWMAINDTKNENVNTLESNQIKMKHNTPKSMGYNENAGGNIKVKKCPC